MCPSLASTLLIKLNTPSGPSVRTQVRSGRSSLGKHKTDHYTALGEGCDSANTSESGFCPADHMPPRDAQETSIKRVQTAVCTHSQSHINHNTHKPSFKAWGRTIITTILYGKGQTASAQRRGFAKVARSHMAQDLYRVARARRNARHKTLSMQTKHMELRRLTPRSQWRTVRARTARRRGRSGPRAVGVCRHRVVEPRLSC